MAVIRLIRSVELAKFGYMKPGATLNNLGDRLESVLIGGGYAEYCAVPATHLFRCS